LTLATAVPVVIRARPSSPDVSVNRKTPTKTMTMKIQMYLAALRIDCSTARYSSSSMTGVASHEKKRGSEETRKVDVCSS
jgi:hypothetical protein